MQYEFTAGAERALAAAAQWTSCASRNELEAAAVILGLLAEPECQAALMLAGRGIDAAAVRRRWPDLSPRTSPAGGCGPPPEFSIEVRHSLQLAAQLLAEYPQPLALATEHLLLGLVAADHDSAAFLRQAGFDAGGLEAEIHRLYGHRPGPLPLDLPEDAPGSPPIVEEATKADGVEGWTCAAGGGDGGDAVTPTPSNTLYPPLPAVQPIERLRVLRVFDAAANRTREGLRTIEDYVRFMLDDRHLTELCKQLRHDLSAVTARVAVEDRLAARETQADVGTALTAPAEIRREDAVAVLTANFSRVQEGLRSLEEFGKLLDPLLSQALKQLRYRSYTLQRSVEITRASLKRLARARLYVLIDGRATEAEFKRLARALVDAGVDVLQLRDKQLDDRRLIERARLLRKITHASRTLFVMNDRPDLAALAEADGVHLGQGELTVKDTRTIVGPRALVGVSTHSIEQARQAVLDGANYIGVGPTFPSATKHFEQFPGIELLRAVAAEICLPAFAIGGITRENLPQVLAAGFNRVAVGGAIMAADDPLGVSRDLLTVLRTS